MEYWGVSETLSVVGKPLPKKSGFEKVTGQARYASDIRLPGMLRSAIFRSKEPRARIISIETSQAAQVAGIRFILTPANCPKLPGLSHPVFPDEVRFVGEEIAAVAADTEEAAEEALQALVVKYEKVPAVIEPEDSLKPGAPKLAPEGNLVGGEPEVYERGNLREGEAQAAFLCEERYSTQAQHHYPMEPHGCVASWQGGELIVWDSGQGVHMVRGSLARAFGLHINQVRVISEHTGGGFGSKNEMKPYHMIAALLSRKTGRPVRLFMNRKEEFIAGMHRPKISRVIRGGVKNDGTLTAVYEKALGQAGPDASMSWPAGAGEGAMHLYRCPNVKIESYKLLTNTQNPIECRGTTWAPDLFCFEQFMDELAHKLGMDPLELRLKNYTELDPVDHRPYSSKGLRECYERGAQVFGWKWRLPGSAGEGSKRLGIGVSSMVHHLWGRDDQSQAIVILQADGTAQVVMGIADFGTGAETIFAQIAAEELGMKWEHVSLAYGDSKGTPYTVDSSYASRTTIIGGSAVRAAAAEAKRQILALAAQRLKVAPESLTIRDEQILSRADPTKQIPLREIAQSVGRELIIGVGRHEPKTRGMAVYMFGAHFAEVEVDTDTGQVRVLRAVCAHDSGRWINPLLAESQIQGGFMFGMGMALFEERIMDPRVGMMLNDHAALSYFIPTILDAPMEIAAVKVEPLDPQNNINVKGMGEMGVVAAGAAIANAIFNAIGVRIRHYPITPNKVLDALREKA